MFLSLQVFNRPSHRFAGDSPIVRARLSMYLATVQPCPHMRTVYVIGLLVLFTLAGCDSTPVASVAEVTLLAPEIVYPRDGASNAPTTTVLAWRRVEHGHRYEVQWGPSREQVSTQSAQTEGLTFVLSDMSPGDDTWWRVRARRGQDAGTWSATHHFTALVPPRTVPAPRQIEPANGRVNMPNWANLTWEPVPGAISYQIHVTVDEDMLLFQADVEGIQEAELTLSALVYTYPYWWKVRALGTSGYGPWSPVWIFTVKDEP